MKAAAISAATKPPHVPCWCFYPVRARRYFEWRNIAAFQSTAERQANLPYLILRLNRETTGFCSANGAALQQQRSRRMCHAGAFLRNVQGGYCEWLNAAAFQSTVQRHTNFSYLVLHLNRDTANFCSAKGTAIPASTNQIHIPGWRFSRERAGRLA